MKASLSTVLTLLFVLLLAGCKSHKQTVRQRPIVSVPSTEEAARQDLSSHLLLTLPLKDGEELPIKGLLRLKAYERLQVSLLMPLLRSEVARIDLTPDEVLVVDRMNRRYARATREELRLRLGYDLRFDVLEKSLRQAAQKGTPFSISGKELGLPTLEKATLQLHDFSFDTFHLSPTEVGSRYTSVSLDEVAILLQSFL